MQCSDTLRHSFLLLGLTLLILITIHSELGIVRFHMTGKAVGLFLSAIYSGHLHPLTVVFSFVMI